MSEDANVAVLNSDNIIIWKVVTRKKRQNFNGIINTMRIAPSLR